MRRTGKLVLITCFVIFFGSTVASASHQLVGFTTATFNGDEGVLGFTLARDLKSSEA